MDLIDPFDPSLTVPCACGCGTLLPLLNTRGEPSKFVRGHSRRGVKHTDETRQKMANNYHKSQTAPPIPTILCACGCRTEIPAITKRGEPAQFAHGHNRRGADVKPETRAKLSARTTAQMHKKFGPPSHPWARYGTMPGYKDWRKAVLKRDDHTCQSCGKKLRSCFLHAHHIKSWTEYPDLRVDVANGQTLCVPCHNRAHGFQTGKEPQPCACGCGELCDHHYKFLRGHWTRVTKGVFTNEGQRHTPEARKKMSDAHKGVIFTPERKANISKAKKGKTHKGHTNTPETKAKMAEARRQWYEQPGNREAIGAAIKAGKAAKRPPEDPPVPCQCGCGTMLPAKNSMGKPSRFAKGHHRRVQSVSDETRAKMSESAKKRCH